jgi:hypothetical protein
MLKGHTQYAVAVLDLLFGIFIETIIPFLVPEDKFSILFEKKRFIQRWIKITGPHRGTCCCWLIFCPFHDSVQRRQ